MKSEKSDAVEQVAERKTIWVFTPSRTDPKDLEFILVQRKKILKDAVDRVKESALTENKHHLLFVGPRGCGKTHLVTLIVSRLSEDNEVAGHLRIAWLNEDETCTTLLELLVKIHAALERCYPAEYREDMLSPAFDMEEDDALKFISNHLLSSLGSRTLLVVVENLDAIFDGLGSKGQKQLRAFIQEHPKFSIVATAQRLVEDLSSRTSPFFGFFQTEHLKPLNVEEAIELLKNIARLHEKPSVVEFLSTSRGHSRVRALHHLSGGNHRIYIVLSQFITRDSIDALLELFMKMVDELTPYYQERIRWLPSLQRKIIEYLCACEGTVPVKEIAKRLFKTQQTISKQLQELREKGYVEANQRGRESLYEISEPLMRICVEVKENQLHQPLRLLVDFLRVWYDDHELKHRLGNISPASVSCAYLKSAIQRNSTEGNLRKQLFLKDFPIFRKAKLDPKRRLDLLQQMNRLPEGVLLAMESLREGKVAEAIGCLEGAIEEESTPIGKAAVLLFRAVVYAESGDYQKALEDNTSVIELPGVPVGKVALALIARGTIYGQAGEMQQAMDDYTRVIELPEASAELVAKAYVFRGHCYRQISEYQRAIDDYNMVIELSNAPVEQVAKALIGRGMARGKVGELRREIDDLTEVIKLSNAPVEQVAKALVIRGITYGQIGEIQSSIKDCSAVIGLSDAPVEQVTLALISRGLTHEQSGEAQRAIEDYTTVVGLSNAPIEAVCMALYARGVVLFKNRRKQEAQADFETLIHLPNAPVNSVVNAYVALSELYFSNGQWVEGLQVLEKGVECGAKAKPTYHETIMDLIGVVFLAGLSPEDRYDKVSDLLRIYNKHKALPILGDAVVGHIGYVFQAGGPLPATDNLEGWILAWERAAENVPEFRLSIRLLRTAVDFVKAGGKDKGILLNLASTERAILEQALGLPEKENVK